MATTISNGESGSSVRTKLNNIWEGLQINEISETISDTAVDVFVYDTRKDSDGGAWRKRTQHTSWYNETLNTATRGSRKEFPAVAVIVVQSDKIAIYDGDDPDLPMWMIADDPNQVSATYAIKGAGGNPDNTISCVSAMNGKLITGGGGPYSSHGVIIWDFILDKFGNYSVSTVWSGFTTGNLADRQSLQYIQAGTLPLIIDANVNDVAMTVLPNAPIDAATGLPVPTIAVATDGGVSVIKDDGTVVDSSSASSYKTVGFLDDYKLLGSETTGSYSTVIFSDYNSDGFSILKAYLSTSQPPMIIAPSYSLPTGNNFAAYRLGSWGLINVARQPENEDNGMVAHTTSDYNTGWMNGDIKLATLSDTDATNVTGSELVTNGTFDTDTSGWSVNSSATVAHEATSPANSMRVNATEPSGNPNGVAYQSFPTEIGKTYTATATGTKGSGNYGMGVGTSSTNLSYGWDGYQSASNVTQSYTFVATATTAYVSLLVDSTDGTQYAFFDNISVRLAEEDRSVNGNGLQVFGTVTKSAVATGADLVAYSGFTGSNYLQQPYNSNLDFGTGDFCFMGWVNLTGNTTFQGFAGRHDDGSTGGGTGAWWLAGLSGSNSKFWFRLSSGGTATGDAIFSNSAATLNAWTHVAFQRKSGTLEMYVNGEKQTETTPSSTDITNTASKLYLSAYKYSGSVTPIVGSSALARISATAPSPEQIKKIYEDEKVLFQEGAQATLYGSSDAVTALAYDDSTELLHVGTSAGRSVFQGLRRVDNTTTAVGAAISASNNLVADE